MNKPTIPICLLLLMLIASTNLVAQDKKAETARQAKDLVDSKEFVFEATSMLPSRGRSRQLTPGYILKLMKDSLVVDLPYVGTARSAPIGNADVGMKFSSGDFEYTVKDRKKGGWEVTIKPKDYREVRELNLTVFTNKSATLGILSNSKDYISYDGNIGKQ